jgi:hypothetical protein
MKSWFLFLGFCLSLPGAHAATMTSSSLVAEARACYWGFIKLYNAAYFRDEQGVECVQLDYLREFSNDELAEATNEVFINAHGETLYSQYQSRLDQLNDAYAAIREGDQYSFCVSEESGRLIRENTLVIQFDDPEFSRLVFKLWVSDYSADKNVEWNFSTC